MLGWLAILRLLCSDLNALHPSQPVDVALTRRQQVLSSSIPDARPRSITLPARTHSSALLNRALGPPIFLLGVLEIKGSNEL